MSMIYIGCPYWDEDLEVREARVKAAGRYAAEMAEQGVLVYAPVIHGHHIARLFPKLFEDKLYWQSHAVQMLGFCSELRVLMLDGWTNERSFLHTEMRLARRAGKPVLLVVVDHPDDPPTFDFPGVALGGNIDG